jgi:hypothetical protein
MLIIYSVLRPETDHTGPGERYLKTTSLGPCKFIRITKTVLFGAKNISSCAKGPILDKNFEKIFIHGKERAASLITKVEENDIYTFNSPIVYFLPF